MISVTAAIVFLGAAMSEPVVQREPTRGSIHSISETRINQARGNLPANARQIDLSKPGKSGPDAAKSNGSGGAAPTVPATCNQQNASSPACYSATQQARPVSR